MCAKIYTFVFVSCKFAFVIKESFSISCSFNSLTVALATFISVNESFKDFKASSFSSSFLWRSSNCSCNNFSSSTFFWTSSAVSALDEKNPEAPSSLSDSLIGPLFPWSLRFLEEQVWAVILPLWSTTYILTI